MILDKIHAASIHNGGRIKFGSDGKLYITTGDASNQSSAQDINSLGGKILRINKDGSVPSDNTIKITSTATATGIHTDWYGTPTEFYTSQSTARPETMRST